MTAMMYERLRFAGWPTIMTIGLGARVAGLADQFDRNTQLDWKSRRASALKNPPVQLRAWTA